MTGAGQNLYKARPRDRGAPPCARPQVLKWGKYDEIQTRESAAGLQTAVLTIEMWPIDKPIDYPQNARKWTQKAIEKVAASIREYGWRQPVVVDAQGVIVIGHLRRAAGNWLGLKEVPVHVALDLTPAQIRGLRLADNRTHEEAEWNVDLLELEILDLNDLDFDLSLTGFDGRELDA